MDDLISRKAAINAVYDHLKAVGGGNEGYAMAHRHIAEVLEILPSAQLELTPEEWWRIKKLRFFHNGSYAKVLDKLIASAAVDIIRCKDCKHYNEHYGFCTETLGFGRSWKPNDFCSYAERKEDEHRKDY